MGPRGRKKWSSVGAAGSRGHGRGSNADLQLALVDEQNPNMFASERDEGITVATFDYSAENHIQAIELISSLCGMDVDGAFGNEEIERFSSAITFLVQWKYFCYKPKTIRYAYETGMLQEKVVLCGINLPQFSSATVPKMEGQLGNTKFMNSRKDFVLHVGGNVWALDWCPGITPQRPECRVRCEYLAVATHPPESSYHKMGAPLNGRGVVQIWCILNVHRNEEFTPAKPKQRGRKKKVGTEPDDLSSAEGINVTTVVESGDQEYRLEVQASDGFTGGVITSAPERGMENEASTGVYNDSVNLMFSMRKENRESMDSVRQENNNHGQVMMATDQNMHPEQVATSSSLLPTDILLPRLVLCLAHNGKVAWDVKWRPSNANDPQHKHRIGYLAVLLGSGSLEVWEVPSPSMIKKLYGSLWKRGTDPRFVKLEPVFKCSKMKCGDRQSIPLTVEWSTSAPYDLLLVGCHDGMVSILKFSASDSSKDTRPLLCFTADTVPIRAVAWAPDESDTESSNVIVTAGHEGIRFWDIRDTYRPLWDLNALRKVVLSLDWLCDPRCIIISTDDGTLRFLSLSKAAHDGPVTGKSFTGTQYQGLHSFYGSPFSIWSIQASRLTGLVAYCGADGSAVCFQLTRKAVEKDPRRNRPPQFLYGSLTEEDSILTISIPMPYTLLPVRKLHPQIPASKNGDNSIPATLKRKTTPRGKAKSGKQNLIERTDTTLIVGEEEDSCTGEDEICGDDSTTAALKRKATTLAKAKSGKKRNGLSETTDSMCLDGDEKELENAQGGENKVRNSKLGIDIFPPRIVAMHRVRWNVNKGSERWLAYGGAAGIVRCQEVNLQTDSNGPRSM